MVAGRVDFIIDSGGSTPSGRTSICAARLAAASESFFTSFLVFVLATGLPGAFATAPLSAFATTSAGADFAAPGLRTGFAAGLGADFATGFATDFETIFAGTGFPDGFADLDAVFETGRAGARLGVGLEWAALDAGLALEEAAARTGLPAFAPGRAARVRAALVLRELAMNCYLLRTGLLPGLHAA